MSWTPKETETAIWLDANDSSKAGVLNTEFIFLEDKSGNGRHLKKHITDGAAVDNTTFAEMNAARFGGQVMKAPSLSELTEGGVFILVKVDADPNTVNNDSGCWKFGGDSGSQNSHYRYTDGNIYDATGSTTRNNLGNIPVDLSAPHIYNVNTKTGLWEYLYNSVIEYESTTNTVGWAATTYIGGRDNDPVKFYGVIGEIIVTPTFPTTERRNKIEGYLAHKWGVANSLPTEHPYRDSPPETEIVPENPGGQASKVSGVVQIDGTPAERTVRAFGYSPTSHDIDTTTVNLSKSLGHATSDPETGDYTIDLLGGYGKEIFVVAFDDYGANFTPDMAVAVGDRIHPTTPNGHVFECTSAGTLPSTEPPWVVDTETSQLYGSASMIARVFYRPMVHGPVAPEVTNTALPWTPAAATTLFWFDAQDSQTLTEDISGNIEAWADKSGNNHNLSQTDPSLRPKTATINGHTMLDARDGAYSLVAPNVSTQGGDMLISILVEASPAITNGPYDSLFEVAGMLEHSLTRYTKSDRQMLRFQISSGGAVPTGATSTYVNAGVPAHVLTLHVLSGVGAYINLNGLPYLLVDDATITPAAVVGQLMLFNGTNFSNVTPWQGLLGEILMEPAALTAEDVQIREGYLAHKWGIAADLPTNHPYKTDPPVIEAAPAQPEPASPSAQYWRIYVYANQGGSRTELAEVSFLDGAGTNGIATGGTVIFESESNLAANAFDGDQATAWTTGFGITVPTWIGYDFGTSVEVGGVTIQPQYTLDRTPTDFAIEYSDNGTDWTEAVRVTTEPWLTNYEKRTYLI